MSKFSTVKLNSKEIAIEHIKAVVEEVDAAQFIFKNWFPRPGLKEKNSDLVSRIYIGQPFDQKYFDLVENGWTDDHCLICNYTLGDNADDYLETSGYFDGDDWICKTCYEEFVLSHDLEAGLRSLKNS